jgi:peptidoglycan/LPS O-acetylase OafA/YrhL
LLLQELEASGEIDLLRFYGRRARRLLPAALLMILVTLAVSMFVFAPAEMLRYAGTAAATSLYASNFAFLRQATNYFSPTTILNPFLHTWSLAVEEQFYLVWPALLLLTARGKVRSRVVAVALAAMTLASFALCVWLTRYDEPWAFYLSPARAWEFGIGALVSLAGVTRWAIRSKAIPVLGWMAAAALLLSFGVIHERDSFPGYLALLPVAATAGLLVSGAAGDDSGPARILRTAPFQWIGRRSYSIYLWHWPILVLAAAFYPSLSTAGRLGCAVLAVIVAAASYRWLEAPIRNSPWLAMRRARSLGLAFCSTALGVAGALGVWIVAGHFAKQPEQMAITRATRERPLARRRNCLISEKATEVKTCSFGAQSSSFTIVLIGDSHADQWSTPIRAIAGNNGWRMLTYLKSNCSVADIPVYNQRLHRISSECAAWRSSAMKAIVRLRPQLVIIGEFSNRYSRQSSASVANAESLALWSAGMKRSFSRLQQGGGTIAMLRDTPTPQRDLGICLTRARWRGIPENCDIPRSVALDPALTMAESQLAASMPGVHLIDLTDRICGPTTCPALRDGMVVYRDATHIANQFASSLLDPLQAALLQSVSR